ncbi:hypothetical protein ACIQFP_00605 [Nocardiopsis alba]|uniref:hypothetical protein n=1 Tax=Nocardiopsis alba TaxID=53437 RepID=UPI003807D8C6
MLDEMEEIHSAVKGETENSFTQARNELESCFSDLITWNSQTSEKLSEGQGAVMNTVAQTTETVQSAADGIGSLARNPNR